MSGAPPRWWKSRAPLLAVAVILAAVAVALLAGAAGEAPPSVLFLGRFHPIAVHLPVGLLLLVALAEVAALSPRLRPRIEPSLPLLLPLALLSALAAFVLGHFLALEGGFPGQALSQHRALMLVTVVGAALCTVAHAAHASGVRGARPAYRGLLLFTMITLSLGAHQGGVMSHGAAYLTKYAPPFLAPLLGGKAPAPAPAAPAATPAPTSAARLLFADAVLPVLRTHCGQCHTGEGGEKIRGGLLMTSIDKIVAGGDSGPAIVPGKGAESELVRRVLLPLDDLDRMPPDEKPGPTPGEIALVKFWIDRGASATLTIDELLVPPEVLTQLARPAAPPAQPPPASPGAP